MRRFFALTTFLLLGACASTPAPEPYARLPVAGPLFVQAGSRAADVILPDAAPAATETALAPATTAEAVLHEAASRAEIAPAVRARLVETLRQFGTVRLVNADEAASRLLVEAAELGFERGRYLRDSLALTLDLGVRWFRGDELIVARSFSYRSSERPAHTWDAAATTAVLKSAYSELGEHIAEELLMSAGLPRAVGDACGLQGLAPKRLYRPQLGPTPGDWNRFIVLDTHTPTLDWESFAEHARRAGAEAVGETAREVRYDLRLWQVLPGAAPLLVYERQGLTATEHTVEMPLRAATRYFWSVRARFIAPDGSTRVTTWARFRLPYAAVSASAGVAGTVRDPCLLDFIAEPNYYRFATPAETQ
ncbi:MAG: hypothetical protein AB7U81_08405 [Thiohalomonadaceae bacterium]